jgi:hypothetical protein
MEVPSSFHSLGTLRGSTVIITSSVVFSRVGSDLQGPIDDRRGDRAAWCTTPVILEMTEAGTSASARPPRNRPRRRSDDSYQATTVKGKQSVNEEVDQEV